MRILLISNTCSKTEYQRLQQIKFAERISPQQHFFSMLIDGFLENGCKVVCVSARHISPCNCDVPHLDGYTEQISPNLTFVYLPITADNSKRNKGIFREVKGCIDQYIDEDTYIVFDPLSIAVCSGALASKAVAKRPKLAVVTDLPMYVTAIDKGAQTVLSRLAGSVRQAIFLGMIRKMDSLCFLTKSMEMINQKAVPTVVVEGMVSDVYPAADRRADEKITVLYAGGLYEKFGIKALVEAATRLPQEAFALHLYGEGNCVDYINEISANYPQVQYKGILPHDQMKAAESMATILVNPRPTGEAYTEFSFPSKTLEYMATGRPVLTTRLKGIPEEYFDYVYTIDESGAEGLFTAIKKMMEIPLKELDAKGQKAQQFVKEEKNAKRQVGRIIELLKAK